ncbi:MAG: hypothetical protein OXF52_03235 [Candidatus Dadabacteria bacterium]|nr:hypothetical protein [Candidatus Dadabacteria bacterium]
MLVFNTHFPIDSCATLEQLTDVVIKWVAGSPHSQITDTDIRKKLPQNEGKWMFSKNKEAICFRKERVADYSTVGAQYSRRENSTTWTTEIAGTKWESRFIVSIRNFYEADRPSKKTLKGNKPHIIKTILEDIGAERDGILQIQNVAHYLSDSDTDIAVRLINGDNSILLPVVYVSAKQDGVPSASISRLARKLSGMAHIVVEPSRDFSFKIKDRVGYRNAYDGVIGIYWPDSSYQKLFSGSSDKEIYDSVRDSLNEVRTYSECSWRNIEDLSARRERNQLKEKGSTDLEEYIKTFDTQLEAKDGKLNELERENDLLKDKLRKEKEKQHLIINKQGDPLLKQGQEKEFYDNEHKFVILYLLKNLNLSGRQKDIVCDIIKANKLDGSEQKKKIQLIKSKLKAYRKMDKSTKTFLETLGFTIEEGRTHYRAKFGGDDRYLVSISKTSSDKRSGNNLASEIVKKFFPH